VIPGYLDVALIVFGGTGILEVQEVMKGDQSYTED
jgi:hypothetical protein